MAELFVIGTIGVAVTGIVFTGKKICEVFQKQQEKHRAVEKQLRVKLLIERRERIKQEEECSIYREKIKGYTEVMNKLETRIKNATQKPVKPIEKPISKQVKIVREKTKKKSTKRYFNRYV